MLWIIAGIAISYLFGSIPTAFIFGKSLKGIDIRKFGSGNVGATNALRVLGKGTGIIVLSLDILKGIIPVVMAGLFFHREGDYGDIYRILIGVSCICGHNWTVFLNFKGGKGIATTLGVLIGLSLKTPGLGSILLFLVLGWLLVFLIFRIVSLASITSAFLLPISAIFFKQSPPIIYATILLALFIIIRHKSNIINLLQGKEKKLDLGKRFQ